MNRIYKVIWSKVKHQYVVTSEFAHSCTKSTTSRVGKSAVAALAAFVLTAGVGGVHAESINLVGEVTDDTVTTTALSTDDVKYVIEGQELDITVTGLNDSGIIGGTASTYGLAIGENSNAYVGGVAVGSGSNASGVNAVAVGRDSHAIADGASTFGYHSTANAAHSVALGDFSIATEENTVSVGNDNLKRRVTNAADARFVAGSSDLVTAGQLVQAGITPGHVADGVTGGISIGDAENTRVEGNNAIAIGDGARATKDNAISIGAGSRAYATSGIALGISAQVYENATNSIALGDHSIADRKNTVSVGKVGAERQITNVAAGTAETDAVNVKQLSDATVGAGMVTWDSVLDEDGKPIEGKYTDSIHGVGLQEGGKITGTSLMTNSTIAGEDYSVRIENGAVTTTGKAESSIGGVKFQSGKVTAENATVNTLLQVGASSNPNETTRIQGGTIHTGSVIGLTNTEWTGTTDNESRAATEGQLADLSETVAANAKGVVKWDDGTNDTIHGVQLAGDGAISAASDRFSVDRYGNIAAKTYGGQGDDTNYYFDMNHADGISMGYSNGTSMNIDPYGVHFKVGEQETLIYGNTMVTGRVNADTVQADAMYVGTQEPGNAVVTQNQLTDMGYDATKGDFVQYDQDGSLHAGQGTSGRLDLNAEDGSASLTSSAGNGFTANADGSSSLTSSAGNGFTANADGTNTIQGNTNINGSLTVNGDTLATSGDVNAVSGNVTNLRDQIGLDQGQTVSDALNNEGKTLVAGINQNTAAINKNTEAIKNNADAIGDVSALKGTNADGSTYTNLTDAVNGNYDRIEQNPTAIVQNSQAINSLGHRVSDLGDEIDSVGAISAALAGLHPLDYDGTGSKFQISAAMGTYDGTQAAAIGGFYHFNRDVMLSLGGATSFEGDKKTAANIGVTFRVGEGVSGKSVSDDVMARLEAMDQKIAALEQENKELKNVLGAIDTSLSKEFPDVPANHWAYEAVTKLAGNDVVAGYPDGEFHGDRTMTRYEMAEIIYKAMNRGAQVDQKLVEEFKPEMEQVAANETAQAASAETAQATETKA